MSDTSIAQNSGFSMLPNWAVDDDRLGGYDLLVYMALIRHADNTGVCWPSLERLA